MNNNREVKWCNLISKKRARDLFLVHQRKVVRWVKEKDSLPGIPGKYGVIA